MGTPAFMSPEQAAGQLDCSSYASDVYSLGATFYYLLTGQEAFFDTSLALVLAQFQLGEFVPPRLKNPRVAPALEAICLKAMALQPNRQPRCGGLRRPDRRNPTPHLLRNR